MALRTTGLGLGSIIGLGIFFWPTPQAVTASPQPSRIFTLCHTGGGTNCVVDGDTIWMDGEKIRLADIDTPETHPPRCDLEADLGNRATQRLLQLVNAGPFEAKLVGNRDQDRYGRKLRVLVRNGESFGRHACQQRARKGMDRATRALVLTMQRNSNVCIWRAHHKSGQSGHDDIAAT